MSEKKPTHILVSSTIASIITTIITNPLDVLKVRMQNTAKGCDTINTKCVGYPQVDTSPKPINEVSLKRLITKRNFMKKYSIPCDCIPFKSNIKALIYLVRKEGFFTLANGLPQSLLLSLTNTVTYFYFYESIKKYIKVNVTNHQILLPLTSALTAGALSTCFVFPFEYWKTLQQNVVGVNNQSGIELGTRVSDGFGSLLQRNLAFSGLYWVLVENIRRKVKSLIQADEEGYLDRKNLLISNTIAALFASAITSAVTTPLDTVKTRKQLFPEEYRNKMTFGIMREIYQQEGMSALLAGMRQRIAKVTVACVSVLTFYELFSDVLKTHENEREKMIK